MISNHGRGAGPKWIALSRWRCSNTAGSALCVRVGINLRYFRIRLKSHFAEPAGTTTVAATMIHSFLKTTIHFAKSRSVILAIGLIAAAATSMPAAGPNTIVKAVGFRLRSTDSCSPSKE